MSRIQIIRKQGTLPLRSSLVRQGSRQYSLDSGVVFVSTDQGLYRFKGAQQQNFVAGGIGKLSLDHQMNLYTAGGNGVVKKYDPDLNLLWSLTLPGHTSGATKAINTFAQTSGYSYVSYLSSYGSYAVVYVAGIDPEGNQIFATTNGGSAGSTFYDQPSLCVDNAGNGYICDSHTGGMFLQRFDIYGNSFSRIATGPMNSATGWNMAINKSGSQLVMLCQDPSSNQLITLVDPDTLVTGKQIPVSNRINDSYIHLVIDYNDHIYYPCGASIYRIDSGLSSNPEHYVDVPEVPDGLAIDIHNNVYALYTTGSGISSHTAYVQKIKDKQVIDTFHISGDRGGGIAVYPGPLSLLNQARPQKPANLQYNASGDTSGIVSWDYPSANSVGFDVFVGKRKVTAAPIAARSLSVSFQQQSRIQVQAVNAANGKRSGFAAVFTVPIAGAIDLAVQNYKSRVQKNGGIVTDETYVHDVYDELYRKGILNNLLVGIDPNAGVAADTDNYVSKLFDVSPKQNDAWQSSQGYKPILQTSGLGKKSTKWYSEILHLTSAVEMIDSTAFFIVRHSDTGSAMIMQDSHGNRAQVREDGTQFNLNGANSLGGPYKVGPGAGTWKIDQSLIKKQTSAQVGINGSWGAQTSHSQTTWPVDMIGAYNSSSYMWHGEMAGIFIFDALFDGALVTELLDFFNSYYGVF